MTRTIAPDDPCPCNSGTRAGDCCLSRLPPERSPSTLVRLHFRLLDADDFTRRLKEHPFFTPRKGEEAGIFEWVEVAAAGGSGSLGLTFRTGKVLGLVWTSRDRATLECFGRLKAERGRRVLENIFRQKVRFLAATYQTTENLHGLEELPRRGIPSAPEPERGGGANNYLENSWIHEPNQALGGLSPLACARNPKRRPKLASLLVELKTRGGEAFDIDRVARLLGVGNLVLRMGMEDKIDRLKHRLVVLMDSLYRFIKVLEESNVDPAHLDAGKLNTLVEMESSLKDAAARLEERLPSRLKELEAFLGRLENMETSFFDLMHEIIEPLPQRDELVQRFNDPDFNHHAPSTSRPEGSRFGGELFDLAVNEAASQLENQWCKSAEEKEMSGRVSLASALRKQPTQWVRAIYLNLGLGGESLKKDRIAKIVRLLTDEEILRALVNTVTPRSLSALKYTLERGGVGSHPRMRRLFGSDENDGFYWAERPPASPLGVLRARGLLVAGRVKKGNRLYRSLIVPRELRPPLSRILFE